VSGSFSHLDGYSLLIFKPDFRLHTEPAYERIVLGNGDRPAVNGRTFQYLQEAKPARQSCEIADKQVASRQPLCRGLVAETES
jgi:hypothetical protein